MTGVRRLQESIGDGVFLGAHLHTYGFGMPVNDRKYYPFYAKCVELGIPVVMQVGHSAERMPSEMGRPLHIDDIALDFPELTIVGRAHRLAVGGGDDRPGLEAPQRLHRDLGAPPEVPRPVAGRVRELAGQGQGAVGHRLPRHGLPGRARRDRRARA